MPGLVGLNNMSRNDYVNVIVEVCPWVLCPLHGSEVLQHLQHFNVQVCQGPKPA